MKSTHASVVGVGCAVVVIGAIPPALVEYARSAGAIGTVNRAAIWVSIAAVLALFGGLAALLMRRALSATCRKDSHLTAWVAALPGLTIWLLGGLTTPLLLALWNLREELKGLDDAGLGLFGEWVLLLVLFGSLAAAVSLAAFTWCNRSPDSAES